MRNVVVAVTVGAALWATPVSATAVPPYQALSVGSPTPQPHTVFGQILHTVGDIDHDGVREVITTAQTTVGNVKAVGRVWVLDGATGAVLLTLDDPEPQPNAGFGSSITGLGDVNNDGVPDIAVGAPFLSVYSGTGPGCDQPQPNGCHQNQGRIYVFSGRDGHMLYAIDDPRPQVNAYFGALFATGTNDVNGDGVPDLAATAPGENVDGLPNAGAAYIFEGGDGHVVRRIVSPNPETFTATNEAFFSMGLTDPGDIDGDHVDDLVVGFASASVGGNVDQGRAYLLSGRTGALLRTFDDPVPQSHAYFGTMYSDPYAPGDVNGDGVPDVYVDADGQIVAGLPNAGQAYVFSGRDGHMLSTLRSPMPQDSGFFGFIFSPAGSLYRDGRPDLLVGQTGAAHVAGAYAQGGAWVFDPRTGNVLADFSRLAPDAGQGVGSPGDVNRDGTPDYFVGAPRTDVGDNARQGVAFQVLSVPGRRPGLTERVLASAHGTTTSIAVDGRLRPPPGVSALACGGIILVAVDRGRHTLVRGRATVGPRCTYGIRLSFRSVPTVSGALRDGGRSRRRHERVAERFLGNFLLTPATASRRVR